MKYGICNDNGNLIAKFAVPTTVVSNQPVFSTDTLSLHRRTMVRGAQRWEIASNVEPLGLGANELFASLVMKGHHSTLDVYVPQNIGVIETMREKLTSEIDYSIAFSNRVNANGRGEIVLGSHVGVDLPVGTFVTFTGDTKVYMLIQPVTSNNSACYVYPQLKVTGPVSGGVMKYTNVKMKCFYDTDTIQGMVYQDGVLMDMGTVKLVEALA
jgi:hypothetical protein